MTHFTRHLLAASLALVLSLSSSALAQESFSFDPPSAPTLEEPVFAFPVEVQMEAHFEETSVPANREAKLLLTLEWTGRLDEVEFEPPATPDWDGLVLEKVFTSNWKGIVSGQPTARRIYTYIVKPTQKGTARARGLQVEYTDKPTGNKQRMEAPEATIEVTDAIWDPEDWQNLYMMIVLGILGIAFLIGTFLGLRSAKRKRQAIAEAPKPLTPLEKAQRDWEELRKVRLLGDYKEWYGGISEVVRAFIHDIYGIETTGKLTSDLTQQLQAVEHDLEKVGLIQEVLEQCDIMKFAGYEPQAHDLDSFERKATRIWQPEPTPDPDEDE